MLAFAAIGCGSQGTVPGLDASADAAVPDVVIGEDGELPPPDGSVRCGIGWNSVWCDPRTEYCQETGLTQIDPLSGTCLPLPSPCLSDRTCACLVDAGVAVCPCVLEDSGILLSGCFDP